MNLALILNVSYMTEIGLSSLHSKPTLYLPLTNSPVFSIIFTVFFLYFVKRFGCVLGKVPKLSKLQNCSKSTEALIKLWSFRPIKIHRNNVLTANVRSKLPNLPSTK